jgi:hypothetical protein
MIVRIGLVVLALCTTSFAQDPPTPQELVIRVEPAALTLPIGATAQLKAEVVDVGGRPVDAPVFFFSRERRAVRVDRDGKVLAREPGEFEIVARVAQGGRGGPSATVKVTVPQPTPVRIELTGAPTVLYAGTRARVAGIVVDQNGHPRTDLPVALASSDPKVAEIDAFGFVEARSPGQCTLRASGGELEALHSFEVRHNPVVALELRASADTVRTGDVVTFTATPRGEGPVGEVPVQWSFQAMPDDDLGPGASGQIEPDGRFVAETPGLYTIVASCGSAVARKTVRATERFPAGERRRLELVGRGEVLDTHTSDLWVWQGVDGRDYAVTGTWGANGDAHFWDVTDPGDIERIATVRVDARTVNDVKVSEDGRICVLSARARPTARTASSSSTSSIRADRRSCRPTRAS